jgi:type I restriction enzyme, S subunit
MTLEKQFKTIKSLYQKTEKIPKNWSSRKFEELFTLEKGKIPKIVSEKQFSNSEPYLTMECISDKEKKYATKKETVEIKKSDLIMLGDGAGSGKVFTNLEGILSSTFYVFKPKNDEIDSKLVYYFLDSIYEIFSSTKYGTSIPHLDKFILKKIQIPIPSKDEQKEIISILENLEKIISTHNQIHINSIKIKNFISDHLIIHGLNHKKFSKILLGRSFLEVDIPIKWKSKKIKDIAKVNGRIGWKNLRADEYVESGPMMLTVWSMPDDAQYGIDWSKGFERLTEWRYEESPEIQLKKDDVLLSKDGSNIGKVGWIKKVPEHSTVNSHIAVIHPNNEFVLGEYLYWYLRSTYFQKYCKSSISGTGTPGFSQDNIRKAIVPLPDLDEQKEISQILSTYENKIYYHLQLSQKLESLKKGLMQKLLTGEIRVKV